MIDPAILLLSMFLATQPPAEQAAEAKAETQTTALAAKEDEANDDDKVICRRTAVIGSKFKKKMCGTKKQWETLEAESRDAAQRAQSRGKGLSPNGG